MRRLGMGIIGAGRVGKALAVHLARAGWRISGLFDIDIEKAELAAKAVPTGFFTGINELARRSDIIFITVYDGEIARVAEQLGELNYVRARFLFHASGILPAKILHLAGLDRAVYSLHPFGGIPLNPLEKNPFKGLYFSGEGDEPAKPIAERMTSDLGGEFIAINSREKVSYHLAASFIANHLFALLSSGESLLRISGLPEDRIQPMALKMATSALDNYRKYGLIEGLTGPVVRGDELTIAEHIIAAEKTGRRKLYEAGVVELRRMLLSESVKKQIDKGDE
ncbi:hypothetical protein DRQ36_01420 [bacterium]|nr:MAG: hypothetical protein DRQ36_01420 [bacterium]